MKFTTNSALPLNFLGSSRLSAATPTGQASRRQTRIITHPATRGGAGPKPHSARRRDQPAPRRRVPLLRDPRVRLGTRELAPLPRLAALRHLDLEVGRVHEVLARDAEASRRDLLDRAAPEVAVGVGPEAIGVFA